MMLSDNKRLALHIWECIFLGRHSSEGSRSATQTWWRTFESKSFAIDLRQQIAVLAPNSASAWIQETNAVTNGTGIIVDKQLPRKVKPD